MVEIRPRVQRYYRRETSPGFEPWSKRNRGSNLPNQSQYPLTCWNSEMMTMIAVMAVVLRSTTINCALSTTPVAHILPKIQGSATDRRADAWGTAVTTNAYRNVSSVHLFHKQNCETILQFSTRGNNYFCLTTGTECVSDYRLALKQYCITIICLKSWLSLFKFFV